MNLAAGIVLGFLVLGTCQAGDISYDYDALNRLTKVTYDDGSTVEYEYDLAGNITRVIKKAAPKGSQHVMGKLTQAPAAGTDDGIIRDVRTNQSSDRTEPNEGSD